MPIFLFKLAKLVWLFVPQSLRQHSLVAQLKSKVIQLGSAVQQSPGETHDSVLFSQSTPNNCLKGTPVPAASQESTVRVVSTLAEVDEMLHMLDEAAAISDDELRRGFQKFHMTFPMDLPPDPCSPEYRDKQMQLYEWLHGKPYTVANEVSAFDVKAAARSPFPFYTESPSTVGNHIISIGHIIRTMNLPAKSSVLEFGPGWGNTTVWLARMGYDVTAVDIEKNFVELINERAKQKGLKIRTMQGDFSLIAQFERQFDAVLFFECFHHCSDHRALIAALDRVVAPNGKVIFAAEPITDDFPIPWGLRLDGESLWAIRKSGWLELGFQERYFRTLLADHGWNLEKFVCHETPWGVVFVATRKVVQAH